MGKSCRKIPSQDELLAIEEAKVPLRENSTVQDRRKALQILKKLEAPYL
jgi:hypothetical protein